MGLNGKVRSRIVILSCCARAANFFSMGWKEEAAIDVGHSRDEAASSASSAAVNLILEGMRKMQEELLSVRRGQEEAAKRSERNAREDSYSFKRKGNELQFKFNDKVADKVAAAAAAIGKGNSTSSSSKALLDRAAKELQEGVFTSGVWPLLSNLEDPELRRLAQALPATVLRSRADSTTKKYLGAYQRWKTWADARQGVPSFPVQELHLVLYMQHLSESRE